MLQTKKVKKARIGTSNDLVAGLLFTAPAWLGFLLFTIGPMLLSLFYSFTSFDGVTPPVIVGVSNYKDLFSGLNPFFSKSITATVKYTLLGTPIFLVFSLSMALLVNSANRLKGLFRTSVFLPAVIPQIAACLIWKWLTDPSLGVINNTLKLVGISPQIKWFYGAGSAVGSMILMWVWSCGATMIVLLAGLQDVPRSLYEAMEVDGGGAIRKLYHVTLPMISPSILFCGIVSFVAAIQCFVPPYAITNGGPGNRTLFYVFYMYREAFSWGNMGMACAIAWVMFVVLIILTQLISRLTDKWIYYGGD